MSKKKLLFVGPIATSSGYGVHARQLLKFLLESGTYDIYARSIRWGETSFLHGDPSIAWVDELLSKQEPSGIQYDIAVQVTIPNEFKRYARFNVGITAGIEVDRVSPTWIDKCNKEIDLLIVPSIHSRDAFLVQYQAQDGSLFALNKQVIVVPEGVDVATFFPREDAVSPVLDQAGVTGKNILFVGLGMDKRPDADRKNLGRLVEWFCKTFKGQNVGLVVKGGLVNGSLLDFQITQKRLAEIKKNTGCGEFPRLHLVHGRVTDSQLAEMYCDQRIVSMVSLTHGEGYGLPLIEAAACDLPVVATDWSGHLDFLTKDGKKLFVPVQFDLKEIPPESVWEGVIDPGTNWAWPKEDDACLKMQKVMLERPVAMAQELGSHVRNGLNLQKVGQFFNLLLGQAFAQFDLVRPANKEDLVQNVRSKLNITAERKNLLYTMPMSAGDVFLSTAIVSHLRQEYPQHRIFFATSQKYFEMLEENPDIDDVIEWSSWMTDVGILEDLFDEIYTPNLGIQMAYSNWMHRGQGRNLLEEMANHCDVEVGSPSLVGKQSEHCDVLVEMKSKSQGNSIVAVHAGAGQGQWSARAYAHWKDLVANIRKGGTRVVQVGAGDDLDIGQVDLDLRGKTSYRQLWTILGLVDSIACIDSLPMHMASTIGKPVVALFGGSYPSKTGPTKKNGRQQLRLLETPDRKDCDRACYKNECKIDKDDPCINEIRPKDIFDALSSVTKFGLGEFTESFPKLGGYTHILNPKIHSYPYLESINSMLGFCDEVVVVDGGSTDGSIDELKTAYTEQLSTGKLRIETRKWDHDEPGMDGMQKAFGRAMCSPNMEFLWQQDADEVVHPADFEKIKSILKKIPPSVKVLHLPVIELWGDTETCRTDRHAWKWRIIRNDFRITHGINIGARLMDQKTGRYYSKKGMSDGCEFIDIVTGEHLPHAGFYTEEIENLRRNDPQAYGAKMNDIFGKLPSVWHYSWKDLPRKVRNFRDFWDTQWSKLYRDESPTKRFPDVESDEDVLKKAEELRTRGGEHQQSVTFKLQRKAPHA